MGDEIMNASGGSYPVECVELEEKQEIVYNFQVEDYHTYYVGENSILVHNDCPEGEVPTEGGPSSGIPDKAKDIASQVKGKNSAALPGYKGGKVYQNMQKEGAQKLPDGSVWYTDNHYEILRKLNNEVTNYSV